MMEQRAENALTVSALNRYIRMKLEQDDVLQQVCVQGELSNVTYHRSGHIYLRLKDENSVISGVMFRFNAANLSFRAKDGMRVIAYGNITVYEPGGNYQIRISTMLPDGRGKLAEEFEQLKKKLDGLGLFAADHKKTLPKFPRRIGVVTSPTGAAIRDIIKVCGRRYPAAQILLYPVMVQGDDAARQITDAVEWFDANRAADVLIVGRGGGSMEDLWCFNDEALVYAIYNCDIPVVSAVGHEIDFTLCDFAADVRAATPSMAAELVCPDCEEYIGRLLLLQNRMADLLQSKTQHAALRLNALRSRPLFSDATYLLSGFYQRLSDLENRSADGIGRRLDDAARRFERSVVRLDALSPVSVMARGYAAVFDPDGHGLRDLDHTRVGDRISLRLGNKKADCLVEHISEVE